MQRLQPIIDAALHSCQLPGLQAPVSDQRSHSASPYCIRPHPKYALSNAACMAAC
jgi:hypothetical protein